VLTNYLLLTTYDLRLAEAERLASRAVELSPGAARGYNAAGHALFELSALKGFLAGRRVSK
jgi:hypothetical protein